jgi:SAM-dependent methyltransferase
MVSHAFTYIERQNCVCGSALAPSDPVIEKTFAWGNVRFVNCSRCFSWIQSPQVSVESLTSWYDSEDYQSAGASKDGAYLDYASEEQQRRDEARSRFYRDLAPTLKPKSRVLEVGCASGSLLSVLGDAGHEVYGIDLSAKFAEQARCLYGIPVEVGDFLAYHGTNGPFDLVMMLGTVSNLQDAEKHLAHAGRLLKPGGWLYFNMPIANSLVARLYGKNYWMFAPSVTNFFTEQGIRAALDRAGFRIVKVRHDRQMPTVSKLLGHARVQWAYPLAMRLGVTRLTAPFSLPIPGIIAVWATPHGQ